MKRLLAMLTLVTAAFGAWLSPPLALAQDERSAAEAPAASDVGQGPAAEPCFESLCVGETIDEIQPLNWTPVTDPTSGQPLSRSHVSDGYVSRLMKVLRGDEQTIKALAPYWFLRRLDGEGIKQLDKVVAVCQPLGVSDRLRAQYISPEGYRTLVSFEPVPSDDGRTQNFVIATMTRFFADGMNADQIKQLGRDIAQRYAGFGTYPRTDKPGVRWLPFADEGPTLKLFAPIGDVFRRGVELRRHPACQ